VYLSFCASLIIFSSIGSANKRNNFMTLRRASNILFGLKPNTEGTKSERTFSLKEAKINSKQIFDVRGRKEGNLNILLALSHLLA
jgi:hypothetical protein